MARGRLIILLLLLMSTCLGEETAADKAHEGNALYKEGDFAGAVKQYEEAKQLQPNRLAIDFNMGDAYYRQKEYPKAADAHKTASGSENVLLSAESHYNIGNSRYREGAEGKPKEGAKGAVDKDVPGDKGPPEEKGLGDARTAKWEKALNAYKSAIELLAKDENSLDGNAGQALENARANYEFVKQKLDQEKQNQQQDQQQNKAGGGGGAGDQKKEQQDKGDKDQDKKQPQDKQQQDKDKNKDQQQDKQQQDQDKNKDKDKDKDQQQQKPEQGDQDKQKPQPQPQPRDTQEQEQDQQQPQPAQGKMTEEEAEELLGRLRSDQEERERKKLQEAQRQRRQRIVKDW